MISPNYILNKRPHRSILDGIGLLVSMAIRPRHWNQLLGSSDYLSDLELRGGHMSPLFILSQLFCVGVIMVSDFSKEVF